MNIIRLTHQLAMEMNTIADVAMAKGYQKEAIKFYKNAFELEKEAALLSAANKQDLLPRFVFLRGAAALANKAGLYQESESLIKLCKSENPPVWLLAELQEIEDLIRENTIKNAPNSIGQMFQLEGVFAEVNSTVNEIIIEDGKQQAFSVVVPRKSLLEIIQKYWSKKVQIQARKTLHGTMILEKIRPAA